MHCHKFMHVFNSPFSRTVQINEFASVVFHGGKSENDYIKESEEFTKSRGNTNKQYLNT
jgi:hypothetical protein